MVFCVEDDCWIHKLRLHFGERLGRNRERDARDD
jgi:hypothetical protein